MLASGAVLLAAGGACGGKLGDRSDSKEDPKEQVEHDGAGGQGEDGNDGQPGADDGTTSSRTLEACEQGFLHEDNPGRACPYIADGRFFKDLPGYYRGELLILNVVFVEPRPPSGNILLPTDHLSVPDAERIINIVKPKMAIITHFGMGMWRADPQRVARYMTERTGIRVIAAKDGMQFKLSELDA